MYSMQCILQMSLFCANGAKVGCRLVVWHLNTFGVSQVPFWVGEGSAFYLFMGPFEPACFKDVHLMNPEAPNGFHRVLCRQKQRRPLGCANFLQEVWVLEPSAGLLSVVRICESSFFFKKEKNSYWQVQLTFEVATESIHGSWCLRRLCSSPHLVKQK